MYVKHPRFGSEPIVAGGKFSRAEIERAYWGYSHCKYFQDSAILADTSKQNHGAFAREIYVDIEKRCRSCNRLFLFFALEQKYWYEDLGFYIDVDCMECTDCRRSTRALKQQFVEYGRLIKSYDLADTDRIKLGEIAVKLLKSGHLKNTQNIKEILNGIKDSERYDGMAKKIKEALNSSTTNEC